MKKAVLFVFILFAIQVQAQTFHFNNSSTTLIKTTNETPAHWYIEIFSDVATDTTLRWKAFFEDVPSQWVITFDDQNNFYSNVLQGDSADFTLYTNPPLTQKLIIGAFLNNTPANASVYFEIYDPALPQNKDTIAFHFIITQGNLGLSDLLAQNVISIQDDIISSATESPMALEIYDATGKLVFSDCQVDKFDLKNLRNSQNYYLRIKVGNENYMVNINR